MNSRKINVLCIFITGLFILTGVVPNISGTLRIDNEIEHIRSREDMSVSNRYDHTAFLEEDDGVNAIETDSPINDNEHQGVPIEKMNIADTTLWQNQTIIFNENLIINSTGNLTLINTTLIFNCSYSFRLINR